MADERFHDQELDRFWDAVVNSSGGPVAGEFDLDPAAMRSVRRFQDRGRVRPPDPVRDRVRRSVMARIDQQHHGKETPVTETGFFDLTRPIAGPNGRTDRPATAWPRLRFPAERRKWLAAQVATALLLVVTLFAVYVAFRPTEQPAVIIPSPVPATPASTPMPTPADVPSYKADAARTGINPGPGPTGQPVELWRADLGAQLKSSPAVVAGVLYAGGGDGKLHALDAATGAERWTFTTGGPIGTSPTVAGGLVFIGSSDGTLYAVDAATGTQRWSLPKAGNNVGTVAVDGTLYAGADAGVLALDAATGVERWRYTAGGAISGSHPAFANGIIYQGTSDNELNALNAADGSVVWRFKTDGGRFTTPAVADGIVYQGNPDAPVQRLYALDAATGAERWRFAVGAQAYGGTVGGGIAYVVAGDGAVYALDAASGQLRWRFATDAGDLENTPALVDDTLYVGGEDGNLYALDSASGEVLWQVTVGAVSIAPVVTGGRIYVPTVDGTLVALGDASAAPAGATAAASEEVATPTVVPVSATTPTATSSQADIGSPTLLWQASISGIWVAVAPDGNVWVQDLAGFKIFRPDGTLVETWAPDGIDVTNQGDVGAIGAVAFDAQGNVYVGARAMRQVRKYDSQRQFVSAIGTLGSGDGQFIIIEGIAITPAGDIYVSDSGRYDVQEFAPDGTFLRKFGEIGSAPGQFSGQIGIALDADGHIYVADFENRRVEKFAPDGTFLTVIDGAGSATGRLDRVNTVAVDGAGNLYVSNEGTRRIVVFDPTGRVIAAWEGPGEGAAPFTGVFAVALDGQGHLYVTDFGGPTGNGRLDKLQLPSPLASVPSVTPGMATPPSTS